MPYWYICTKTNIAVVSLNIYITFLFNLAIENVYKYIFTRRPHVRMQNIVRQAYGNIKSHSECPHRADFEAISRRLTEKAYIEDGTIYHEYRLIRHHRCTHSKTFIIGWYSTEMMFDGKRKSGYYLIGILMLKVRAGRGHGLYKRDSHSDRAES